MIERLLCDGRLRTNLFREDGSLFDLGRTRRVVSKRVMRALLERDGGCCTHPGCGSRDGLEAHHVRHWLHGGRTDLANLVVLCRRHHHAHHREEFSIGVRTSGRFVLRRPDGLILEDHVDPARLIPSAPDPLAAGPDDAPSWTGTGERLDRHRAIAVLAQRRENARLAS
ncbi:HNH endonuclease [uncultured Jatrophihabitans sp.]|uniref:HNH endonuclease n=1 Tax=uncultured Jatrophihabitans sp. TaxID=1610747 RepID=UPI0035C9813F